MNIVYSVYFVCSYITSIYSCIIWHTLPMILMPMTQWFYKGQGQIISFHLIKCLLYINIVVKIICWKPLNGIYTFYAKTWRWVIFFYPKSFEKGQGHIVYILSCVDHSFVKTSFIWQRECMYINLNSLFQIRS